LVFGSTCWIFGSTKSIFRPGARPKIEDTRQARGFPTLPQETDARGVLQHPDVPGPIDVIWGNRKGGLLHIITKHPEVLSDLPERLERMKIERDLGELGKIVLASPDGNERAVISTDYKKQPKNWLLTAYTRKGPRRDGGTFGSPTDLLGSAPQSPTPPGD